MIILPAIDLYDKKAVRLVHGDYNQMTVYNTDPLAVARDFIRCGATHIHLVDLEGAKFGTTPNIDIVRKISQETDLFIEIGGGIRSMQTVETYFDCGVDRVILGTAAVNDRDFLVEAIRKHGSKIAVGADVTDGYIAIKGWLEKSQIQLSDFIADMQALGVGNIICTDISKDGAMRGTNLVLYSRLSRQYTVDITASGGVSSLEDIRQLRSMDLYGAIIGKAYYTGSIDLAQAIEVAK